MVHNSWPADLVQIRLYAVCTDSAGTITGGGWTNADNQLPANGDAGAEFTMTGTPPSDPSRCTVAGAPNTPNMGRGA